MLPCTVRVYHFNDIDKEEDSTLTYLDPLISAEGHLLRHLDMDRVLPGVLDNKAVSEGDTVGLGSAQQPATSVVH